jgi:NhaP-type Na+/H+ or K+/H+ antiporter
MVVILLAVSAALRLVARPLRVPHPVLLVLAGLALYWGALTTSLRDFRTHFWPIARYSAPSAKPWCGSATRV